MFVGVGADEKGREARWNWGCVLEDDSGVVEQALDRLEDGDVYSSYVGNVWFTYAVEHDRIWY